MKAAELCGFRERRQNCGAKTSPPTRSFAEDLLDVLQFVVVILRWIRTPAMFVRVKKIGPYGYLYLVENVREGGRHVQRIIKALGRRDEIENSDLLDGLIASAVELSATTRIEERTMAIKGKGLLHDPRLVLRRPAPPSLHPQNRDALRLDPARSRASSLAPR